MGFPRAGLAVAIGTRALELEAAVGLLKRAAASLLRVAFLVGVGTGGWLRAFARDAAVGVNIPEDVLVREVDDGVVVGVLAVTAGVVVLLGVFGRLGVDTAGLDVDLGGFVVGVLD